jgi:hypothetical protein
MDAIEEYLHSGWIQLDCGGPRVQTRSVGGSNPSGRAFYLIRRSSVETATQASVSV